jgi:hypothetical protein
MGGKAPVYRVGYIRQLFSGRAWKSSPDSAWNTVTRARHDPATVRFLGRRLIRGVMYDVFRVPGAYEAQESQS